MAIGTRSLLRLHWRDVGRLRPVEVTYEIAVSHVLHSPEILHAVFFSVELVLLLHDVHKLVVVDEIVVLLSLVLVATWHLWLVPSICSIVASRTNERARSYNLTTVVDFLPRFVLLSVFVADFVDFSN